MVSFGKNKDFKLAKLGDPALEVLSLFARGSLWIGAEIVDAYIEAFAHKSLSQALYPSRVRLITNSLARAGLIYGDNESGFALTPRGKWELARHRILDRPERHLPKYWDGKWRVIVFDIPELERKQRDMLRRAISGYGMYPLQQSVWVYPYQCTEFVDSIKQDLGFASEVLVMLVDEIENQNELAREFSLV